MAIFTGCYYALGTGISNTGVFQECTTYTRSAVSTSGTALSGLTQNVSQITGPTGPTNGIITKGAIFDALTGGNCLCTWDWTTLTTVPNNFLAVTVNIIFNTYLQTALNLALQGGAGTYGAMIDAGAQIGTLNGNPLVTGSRLSITVNGGLVAHLGSGQWIGSVDVQNTLSVGSLASGNIVTGLTALAGGGATGATALPAFINKLSTVATSLDSAILPLCNTGSMVMVTNAGAATANVYPDTGATINSSSANTAIAVAAAKSALFVRVSSLAWFAILSA